MLQTGRDKLVIYFRSRKVLFSSLNHIFSGACGAATYTIVMWLLPKVPVNIVSTRENTSKFAREPRKVPVKSCDFFARERQKVPVKMT